MAERRGKKREPIVSVDAPVLVIEDNELNRAVVGRQLGRLGLSHEFAENGRDGLDLATTRDYAAILTDLSMPVMDGFEFTERFRAWERENDRDSVPTPVIAVTANVTPDDRDRCSNVGMDDFISKPVTMGRLREVLLERLTGGQTGSPDTE